MTTATTQQYRLPCANGARAQLVEMCKHLYRVDPYGKGACARASKIALRDIAVDTWRDVEDVEDPEAKVTNTYDFFLSTLFLFGLPLEILDREDAYVEIYYPNETVASITWDRHGAWN